MNALEQTINLMVGIIFWGGVFTGIVMRIEYVDSGRIFTFKETRNIFAVCLSVLCATILLFKYMPKQDQLIYEPVTYIEEVEHIESVYTIFDCVFDMVEEYNAMSPEEQAQADKDIQEIWFGETTEEIHDNVENHG